MKLFQIIIAILIGLSSTVLYQHRESISDFVNLAIDLTKESVSSHYSHLFGKARLNETAAAQKAFSEAASSSANPESHFPNLGYPKEQLIVTEMSTQRAVAKIVRAIEQSEGAGARVRRSIGTRNQRYFSPFLMLDHFATTAGFPDQLTNSFPSSPHRGQETITYLLKGAVDHEDFAGNSGTLYEGDLQFMTAGRGIVHAEMPRKQPDGSQNVGLQLWVDLPKKLKYCEPRYRDLRAAEIPSVDVDEGRATIKVISGQSHGVDSVKELAYTPVWLLDFLLRPGAKVTQALPQGWNAFAYVLEGNVNVGQGAEAKKAEQYDNVFFKQAGDVIHLATDADATKDARIIVVAGTPLDQPVVQYGPFVLNSEEEIMKTFSDYQGHENGFERAKNWRSQIGDRVY
ncbi:pirin iron-binding nuclear [Trichoderma arundinaceum]|uniref:Pirin iron-binding nuclear n=1 Tax=Trichoderma arundinaceum TaxID=490622 RepID=A0A395NI22_TRIAR|nr:pirin iron-binding nuclear [Trichoderma arundinaceum]